MTRRFRRLPAADEPAVADTRPSAEEFTTQVDVRLGDRSGEQLGEACRRLGQGALVITDTGVSNAGHARDVANLLRDSANDTEIVLLDRCTPATVASAGAVNDAAVRAATEQVLVAVGGGSVIDATTVAACAAPQPWLLDPSVLRQQQGVVAVPKTLAPPRPVVAVPTRLGTAAEVAPRAALAPDDFGIRRLLAGEPLVPSVAVIDPRWSTGLDRAAWPRVLQRSRSGCLAPSWSRSPAPKSATTRCWPGSKNWCSTDSRCSKSRRFRRPRKGWRWPD